MRISLTIVALVLALSCILLGSGPSWAREQRVKLYLPFKETEFPDVASRLQEAIKEAGSESVAVVTADHWHDYQHGLRAGRPGVYLAAPHFAAWAIHQHDFQPIIRLASPLSIVIAAPRNDATIFEMNDLANLPVCARKPLNLDYLLINNAFDNPLLSAEINVVSSVVAEMRRANSGCRGFALSNQQYEELAVVFPDRYIRLQQSMKFNNLVLLSDNGSWQTRPEVVEGIRAFIASESGRAILMPMLSQLAASVAWVGAQPSDYPEEYYTPLLPFWQ